MKRRVVLIDDHPILTDGLKMMLENNDHFEVVGAFNEPDFALSFLKAEKLIDLVILDHSMPGTTGTELVRKIKSQSQHPKIIMLSMHDEPSVIKEAIASGIDGYVLKKSVSDELLQAMHTVIMGRPYWSAEVGQQLFRTARQDDDSIQQLTDRETEVLQLIIKELTSKEIAAQLFISERTVEVHRKNIMRKVKCSNTVGLIKYAFLNGLVPK